MRIASLVPSATETLFALGLGDDVVGVTHECDYPREAGELPHLTRSVIPGGLSEAEIDRAVRERTENGEPIYELDANALLDARPELIVTQALCPVCAVSVEDVRAIAQEMDTEPQILSLDPTTLGEVLADIRTLGVAADAVEEADALVARLADRIDRVQSAVAGASPVPVVTLEWLDPLFVGGHWVPQQVELAGGIDVLGHAGERSRVVEWDELRGAGADWFICMPCGYDLDGVGEQIDANPRILELRTAIAGVDASAHFSRPGPRLVDGVEVLAEILHPELVGTERDVDWFVTGETVSR